MCIGFPGRVTVVDATGATVEIEGAARRASTLLCPDVAVGDWVYVAAGTIVDRLGEAEALEVRSLLLEAIGRDAAELERVQGGRDVPVG